MSAESKLETAHAKEDAVQVHWHGFNRDLVPGTPTTTDPAAVTCPGCIDALNAGMVGEWVRR